MDCINASLTTHARVSAGAVMTFGVGLAVKRRGPYLLDEHFPHHIQFDRLLPFFLNPA